MSKADIDFQISFAYGYYWEALLEVLEHENDYTLTGNPETD